MKYKYKRGGVVKLQNAGSLPKWMQKLNAWANKNISESDESVGERILNSTIKEANNASTQEERDKIYKDSAKNNLAVTGQSLMILPMLGEFTTYGLLGGGLRLGTGLAGSKAGEYVLGTVGNWADKKLNTKFLGTTGRIIGGLGGWWGGSSATTPLFRNLAGKGITLHIPQETFNALRSNEFARLFKNIRSTTPSVVQTNIDAGKLGWAPSFKQTLWHNSNKPLTKLELTFPAWDVVERGAPLGHVWLTGTETTQGFIGARPYHLKGAVELSKPMIQLGESVGNGKNIVRNQILNFAQKSSADGINFKSIADNTLQDQDVYSVFKDVNVNPKKSYKSPIITTWTENPKRANDPIEKFIAGQNLVESLKRGNLPTIDAHGISKGNELEYLESILQHGIDAKRGFSTAPLFITKGQEELSPLLGAALGTSSGTAYNDGLFILTSKPNSLLKNGIDAILINDADPGYARFLKQALHKKYPNFKFVTYGDAPDYYGVKKYTLSETKTPMTKFTNNKVSSFNAIDSEFLPPLPEEINISF